MQYRPLIHLPLWDLWSDKYSLSWYWETVKFEIHLALFHIDSTNIDCIANLNAGGASAGITAQSRYWSCYDTIRTEIHNCIQSTAKVGGTIKWNHILLPTWPKACRWMSGPGSNPALDTRVRSHRGSWPGLGPPGQFQLGPQPGNPEPLVPVIPGIIFGRV